MMLTPPVRDPYSTQNYTLNCYGQRNELEAYVEKEPSAPVYCPLEMSPPVKKDSPQVPSQKQRSLPEPKLDEVLDADLESYVHIQPDDAVADCLPNVPPPDYQSPQYVPYHHRNYQVVSVGGVPLASAYEIRQNCEDLLTKLFKTIIYYAINGVNSSDHVPSFLAIWIPIAVESTMTRRNRYLRECLGNQYTATEKCIERNHTVVRTIKVAGIQALPYLGTAAGYTVNLWHQIREITLIAAIHGHDVKQDDVQAKIFSCLIGGNLFKIVGLSTDHVIREISKQIIVKFGMNDTISGLIPLNTILFNFFTNDMAKVSGHAKRMFAGQHSRVVTDYN